MSAANVAHSMSQGAAVMSNEKYINGPKTHVKPKAPLPPDLVRSAIFGSPLPTLATRGPKHIVADANPAFCRLCGQAESELTGRPLDEIVEQAIRDRLSALLDRVYLTGTAETISDHEHTAGSPGPVYWTYTAWAMLDAREKPGGIMLQVSDTTETVLFRNQIATINGELLVAGLRQHEIQEEADRRNVALEVQATTDGLTGLKNHRAFQERLKEEVERTFRYASPLSVLFLDIDNFKQFNDLYGHLAGDSVLRRIGAILRDAARHTDLVARYGGEEFAVILTETDAQGAKVLAERFRAAVENGPWPDLPVTISVGVNTYSQFARDPISLLAGADEALYRSKRQGRNCVTSAGSDNGRGNAVHPDEAARNDDQRDVRQAQ